MNEFAIFQHQVRRGFNRQLSVVLAIVFKDFRNRLGRSQLGLVWVLLEPLTQMIMLSSLWYLVGRTEIGGVNVLLFIGSGIIPYIIVRVSLSGIPASFRLNSALFDYPQVKPIDALLGRFIFEMTLILVAACILFFILGWTLDLVAPMPYPLECLGVYGLLMAMTLGLSLIVATYSQFYDTAQTAVNVVTRPLIFISAVMYSVNDLPNSAREFLAWNPLLQFIEHFRVYGLGMNPVPELSFLYIFLVSVCSLGIGVVVYYTNRFKILQKR